MKTSHQEEFLALFAKLFHDENHQEIELILNFAHSQLGIDFNHSRCAALIIMKELKWHDATMVKVALLHDVPEKGDEKLFGNQNDYREFSNRCHFLLARLSNPEVADLVIKLTKPELDSSLFKFREQILDFYIESFSSDDRTLVFKAIDRLQKIRRYLFSEKNHCQKTPSLTKKKTRKLIEKTQSSYLPVFEKTLQIWQRDKTTNDKLTHYLERITAETKTGLTKLEELGQSFRVWRVLELIEGEKKFFYYSSRELAIQSNYNTCLEKPEKIQVNPEFYKKLLKKKEIAVKINRCI